MGKFIVQIDETLTKAVEVEAVNEQDALKIVSDKYYKCEIILDADDYSDTKFSVSKAEE